VSIDCARLQPLLINASIQFNVVSKHLGCDRMSFFLNEAAGDIRDMLLPGLQEKAKL
jgi:carnitine O-acetyltransferase